MGVPGESSRVVVGAAVVRRGRVLAARRTTPPEAAGRWELPGGKVEPGESEGDALVREIGEELGCRVEVVAWLGGQAPIDAGSGSGLVLRVAHARLVEGDPAPTEHDEVRWLGPDELAGVDWLEPDRPFLPELRELLLVDSEPPGVESSTRGSAVGQGAVRAVFYEEGDARAVAGSLLRDGWSARVVRERLAGEDDDEDHPWAVLSDAPAPVLDALVDRHDGWLDLDEEAPRPAPLAPLVLPDAPRRIKRPR